MVDLASCYFCGSVESLKEYPVIPQDLYPPDEVQRTVVVCPTCREKLASVLEPVLGYLDAPESAEQAASPAATATPADASTRPDERTTESAAHSTANDRPATGTDGPTSGGSEKPSNAASSQSPTRTAGNGAGDADLLDKIEHDRERVYTDSRDAGYRWDPDDTGSSNGLPDSAKQVARLLQNRDFPVERATIEDLATGAYDIRRRECREAIDALVREGYLTESDGVLREA